MRRSTLIMILVICLLAFAAAHADESNCYTGDHGSDSGPCSDAERARVDAHPERYPIKPPAPVKPAMRCGWDGHTCTPAEVKAIIDGIAASQQLGK